MADPCIVSWPARLSESAGAIRHQFVHAIDVLPTVLDIAGIEAPDEIEGVPQSSIDGVSFGYLLGADGASAAEQHETQHFEMFGSRALYHRGWKAVTFHPVGPDLRRRSRPELALRRRRLGALPRRRGPLRDAGPRLASTRTSWPRWSSSGGEEARRNQVLPLDNRVLWALVHPKPDHRRPRNAFRYFPGGAQVPETVAVNVRNRSHALSVRGVRSETGSCLPGSFLPSVPRSAAGRFIFSMAGSVTCTTSTAKSGT